MDSSFIFVGLGNPGKQYSKNRHNAGFMIVDALASFLAGPGAFPSFKKVASMVEIASFSADNTKIILAKPLTYMNHSGRAVRFLMDFYKIKSENICVFHDDIDLNFGRIKIKKGGGNGGHNGLRSIDELVGREYWRVRIGVGRPDGKGDVASFVLHDFSEDEKIIVDQIAQKICKNIPMLLSDPKKLEQELQKN